MSEEPAHGLRRDASDCGPAPAAATTSRNPRKQEASIGCAHGVSRDVLANQRDTLLTVVSNERVRPSCVVGSKSRPQHQSARLRSASVPTFLESDPHMGLFVEDDLGPGRAKLCKCGIWSCAVRLSRK
jgi:hypothetical protein